MISQPHWSYHVLSWWPQTAKQEGMQQDEKNVSINMENMDNNVMSAQKKMLEVSLAGVGTVLRRERDARSMVK